MSDVRLFLGDCLELMKDIPDGSVDCVVTDPPYGTTNCDWDKPVHLNLLFHAVFRVLKKSGVFALFSQFPFAVDLVNACRKYFRYEIVWHKTRAVGFLNAKKMPLRAHENILVFYRKLPTFNPQFTQGKPYNKIPVRAFSSIYGQKRSYPPSSSDGRRHPVDVLKISNSNHKSLHPTQKPVELMEWLVKTYTNPGDTVLDCFMGSGTTGVACVRNDRKFMGMELQEKYFDIAKNRIDEEIRKVEGDGKSEPF